MQYLSAVLLGGGGVLLDAAYMQPAFYRQFRCINVSNHQNKTCFIYKFHK